MGRLERLIHPIKSDKWKRITFFYTTGEYLLRAKSLNELVINSDERQLPWKSLREKAKSEQIYRADLPDINLPPEVLAALLGIRELQSGFKY